MEKQKPTASAPEKRPEQTPNRKVITGEAHPRKKNALSRFRKAIVSTDAGSVGNYLLMDVIIPALKKTLWDIICNGTAMTLFGQPSREQNYRSYGSQASYRRYVDRRYEDERRERDRDYYRRSEVPDYDDIIFDNRDDADDVLDRMREQLRDTRYVSVADLFDFVGMSCPYTMNKYGWTDLRTAYVRQTRDGFLIDFPPAVAL